jgi:UDP-N-acetylglucosamine diphosphorylase / glucose-1-phosphate thymidylyltransferase / UDP-N-acetylgalactosamine diphosphorylase / glucosamine-1-phosphate N-acetyltransferase / galactosamine-1-phosphate N-acetyltransferase
MPAPSQSRHVVIFEGARWPSFAPLSLSRPVFMLRCGLTTLLEQQIRRLQPTRLTLWVRPHLADYCRKHIVPTLNVPTKVNEPLDDELTLLSGGRNIYLQKYEWPSSPCIALDEAKLICQALIKSPGLSPEDCLLRTDAWTRLQQLPQTQPQARLPDYVWELSQWNEEALVADAIELRDEPEEFPTGPYHLVRKEDVHLAAGVKLSPGVVLDASKGPVVIDADVSVGANSVLEGPCHVGAYSVVSPLTLIRAGSSIGPGCKIGGEISASIILGNTNKAHYGFLGDSYVGEWVNLGAGTTTSNLKNTYGTITMRIGPAEIPTSRRFLGSMIGDHAKTAIGTRLMTGSYIGYCSLVAGSALPPRHIPSFTFWTDKGTEKYRMDKAKEVMTQVLGRRGKPWSQTDQFLLDYVAAIAGDVEGN